MVPLVKGFNQVMLTFQTSFPIPCALHIVILSSCLVFFSGGVYTPAVAFADTPLVENLKKNWESHL